jgi:hypothetical protein
MPCRKIKRLSVLKTKMHGTLLTYKQQVWGDLEAE